MFKPSRLGCLIAAVAAVVVIGSYFGLVGPWNPNKAAEIPIKPDYTLIPVYTLDGRSVYLNAAITPLEFFSVNCPHCQEDLPQIQTMVSDLNRKKPFIYVSTFLNTSDLPEAIKETKAFISKYKIDGTVVIQAGAPKAYVKTVPSLVTLKSGSSSVPEITEGMLTKEELQSALAVAPAVTSEQEKGTAHEPVKH
ncbi:hypothetical protein Desaci_1442 [Desulfosporosinus acidiphilus SJ4]|uniref:Thioredoxin domain-containing protein n=1 Tax=Desulfosporosinus acidiphilus (strain DSM 22704 / JCM 16185 / SJ4) TaxID=646529 RepID=I4D3T5_DESAJ|nr:hypothetical protein [Desulfosporosinus acidiphilus]AFM40459.1 hypothetical protein Desaci_1442 [Desulfosporosinus acidiphilus SJ4]